MNQFYLIHCRTHLHVGSGDSNYGVIDKMVQRDPTDKLPCIFASSLKGAFREYFEEVIEQGVSKDQKVITHAIFGEDDKGKVVFHQGNLLSVPVRSTKFPYFNATSPLCIRLLLDSLELLLLPEEKNSYSALVADLELLLTKVQSNKVVVFGVDAAGLKIEEYRGTDIVNVTDFSPSENLMKILGDRIALFDTSNFLTLTSDYHLPVIARNFLENGQSKNLWYEQIIPRDARFFFAASSIVGTDFYTYFSDEKILQMGANATIGYGVTKIKKLL